VDAEHWLDDHAGALANAAGKHADHEPALTADCLAEAERTVVTQWPKIMGADDPERYAWVVARNAMSHTAKREQQQQDLVDRFAHLHAPTVDTRRLGAAVGAMVAIGVHLGETYRVAASTCLSDASETTNPHDEPWRRVGIRRTKFFEVKAAVKPILHELARGIHQVFVDAGNGRIEP